MNDLLAALLLGIIEGITEFLPISSTGHLLIAEHWLGARSDLFNISIQAGAILAVVLIYWKRLWQLLSGFGHKANRDYALKLALAFGVTGALGLVVKKLGFELPETLAPVAWALLIGGFVILGVEAIDARRPDLPDTDPDAIGWGTAVLVGLAQVLAGVFPGTSRSAAAIFAALLFGRSSRVAATEFAFLVGIPTMFAATGYELLDMVKDGGAANEDWTALAVAFVASAITAFVAVKWLLSYIQTHRFTVFAWYRIVFGAALLLFASSTVGNASATAAVSTPAGQHAAGSARVAAAGALHAAGATAVVSARHAAAPKPSTTLSIPAPKAPGPYDALSREQVYALYRNRVQCLQGRQAQEWLAGPEMPAALAFAAQKPKYMAALQASVDLADEADAECRETVAALRDGSLYELAARAAELGDREAALCYVWATYPVPPAVFKREDFRRRFGSKAAQLIDIGIAAGDWNMVMVAQLAFDPVLQAVPAGVPLEELPDPTQGKRLMSAVAPGGDQQRNYALNRLLALGSRTAPEALGRNGVADEAGRGLSVADRQRGDAWAQSTFASAFRGQKMPAELINSCP